MYAPDAPVLRSFHSNSRKVACTEDLLPHAERSPQMCADGAGIPPLGRFRTSCVEDAAGAACGGGTDGAARLRAAGLRHAHGHRGRGGGERGWRGVQGGHTDREARALQMPEILARVGGEGCDDEEEGEEGDGAKR